MGIRAKVRQTTSRRGTVALASRLSRAGAGRHDRATRAGTRSEPIKRPASHSHALKTSPAAEVRTPSGLNGYGKALRFLSTLSDFERLRIVRYNSQNFDLDRMRTLLKKLGNPQDQFRSVH